MQCVELGIWDRQKQRYIFVIKQCAELFNLFYLQISSFCSTQMRSWLRNAEPRMLIKNSIWIGTLFYLDFSQRNHSVMNQDGSLEGLMVHYSGPKKFIVFSFLDDCWTFFFAGWLRMKYAIVCNSQIMFLFLFKDIRFHVASGWTYAENCKVVRSKTSWRIDRWE